MNQAEARQSLEKLTEASRQLLGALEDEQWALAVALSEQRQRLAEYLVETIGMDPGDLSDGWQAYQDLEGKIRAQLAKNQPQRASLQARQLAAIADRTSSTD